MTEESKPLIPGIELSILPVRIPEHSSSVIGIHAAGHSNFITIVEEGRARKKHLQCGCQSELSLILACAIEETAGIMAVNQVPHDGKNSGMVLTIEETLLSHEVGRAGIAIADHGRDALIEGVVHDGIPFVTLEKVGCIVPYFANDEGIRIDCLYLLTESLPESMSDLITDIEPPAIDSEFFQIMAGNP